MLIFGCISVLLVTDFSGQYVGPIFKGQTVQEMLVTTKLHHITSHKREDLIYYVVVAWTHESPLLLSFLISGIYTATWKSRKLVFSRNEERV